jgi:starvation-inducible DNA-binding protein
MTGPMRDSVEFLESEKRGKDAATTDRKTQESLVRGLNRNLANITSLVLAYKQAHWNLQGPGFAQLHELFDRFANQTREYADLVAERAVTLHGTAHGTIEGTVKETILQAFPLEEHREEPLLKELVERVVAAIKEIRKGINDSEGDLPTQDIYIEIARGLEKQEWMLRSHLT